MKPQVGNVLSEIGATPQENSNNRTCVDGQYSGRAAWPESLLLTITLICYIQTYLYKRNYVFCVI